MSRSPAASEGHPFPRGEPETLIGQWMRARALERSEAADLLLDTIKVTGSFTPGRQRLVREIFDVAVEHWWPATKDLSEAQLVVDRFVNYYADHHEFLYIEVEALVRATRGEDIVIDEIDWRTRFLVRQLLFSFACYDGGVSRQVIDAIVREAEGRAARAGFDPVTPEEQERTGVSSASLRSAAR